MFRPGVNLKDIERLVVFEDLELTRLIYKHKILLAVWAMSKGVKHKPNNANGLSGS